MLASRADAQGAGSLGGSAAARCRRDPRGGLGAVLLGSSSGRLVWIGVAALSVATAVAVGALAGLPRPSFSREAVVALGFFAAFVAWNGLSVIWSIEGDRSWAYFNRGLVYLALAVIGLWLGPYVREWAYVLAGVAGAAARVGAAREGDPGARLVGAHRAPELADRLLERARPALRDGRAARALAGRAAGARPLAARDRGRYLYALVVGLLLTYSRGGVRAAGLATVLWLVLGSPRVESAAALLLGGGAGLGVAAWAFSRPGLSSDGQPHSLRVHDGAWFAVVFVLGWRSGALAYLGSLAEERRPLTDARRGWSGGSRSACSSSGSRPAWSCSQSSQASGLVPGLHRAADQRRAAGRPAAPGERELVEPLALVAGGLARLGGTAVARDRGRDLRADPPPAPHEQHRRHRAAQRAAAVPERDRCGRAASSRWSPIAAAAVGVARRVRGRDRAARRGRARRAGGRVRAALAGRLRLGLRRRDARRSCSRSARCSAGRRAGRAADRVVAAAGRGRRGGRALAADALVRAALDRRGERGARGQAAASRLPRREDARSLNPLALDPLLAQAEALSQLGDSQGARQLYIDAVELQSLNWRAVVRARQLRGGPAGLRPRDPGARARGRARPAEPAHHDRARER